MTVDATVTGPVQTSCQGWWRERAALPSLYLRGLGPQALRLGDGGNTCAFTHGFRTEWSGVQEIGRRRKTACQQHYINAHYSINMRVCANTHTGHVSTARVAGPLAPATRFLSRARVRSRSASSFSFSIFPCLTPPLCIPVALALALALALSRARHVHSFIPAPYGVGVRE